MRLTFSRLMSEQWDEMKSRHERWDIKDHAFQEITALTSDETGHEEVLEDPYEFAEWDETRAVRCLAHICNPGAWRDLQPVKARRHTEIREFLDAP